MTKATELRKPYEFKSKEYLESKDLLDYIESTYEFKELMEVLSTQHSHSLGQLIKKVVKYVENCQCLQNES